MKLQKKIAAAVAGAGLLLNSALPVLAQEVIISGNGAGSDNYATVTQTSTTTVTQSNNAIVTNTIDADADSGGNDANFNTGGDVTIATGEASANVDVTNNLNSNYAKVDCCDQAGADVLIKGNGAFSDNDVVLNNANVVSVDQDNYANVTNDVDTDADSGDNDATKNTGGDVTIVTGKAKTDVDVSTTANSNWAEVGGSHPTTLPTASFRIIGNGAGSDNYIDAALTKVLVLDQDNNAHVNNDVDADADSGDNEAEFNTGGDVTIATGKAESSVDIDNMVNFNHADVDCGCTWDVLAKIEGNGAEYSGYGHNIFPWWDVDDNTIALKLTSTQVYGQDNYANLTNDVEDSDADSGDNESNLNTGEAGSDPWIVTGPASSSASVSNSGNVNHIGDGNPMPWMPDWEDVDVSFNLSAFLAFFGLSM